MNSCTSVMKSPFSSLLQNPAYLDTNFGLSTRARDTLSHIVFSCSMPTPSSAHSRIVFVMVLSDSPAMNLSVATSATAEAVGIVVAQ
eukprot:4749960-Prymnesium_polylepis.1